MGKYVKISCPKCNYVIHPWHLNNSYGMVGIGIPFEQCPNCSSLLIKKNIKEVTMLTTLDYIRMWFWNVLGGVIFCAIDTGLLCIIILKVLNIDDIEEPFVFMVYLILNILFLRRRYKIQQKQIYESKQRLENLEYAKLVGSLTQNSKFNILQKFKNLNEKNNDVEFDGDNEYDEDLEDMYANDKEN